MKEYWFCYVGPVEGSSLPRGGDFPLRQAVRQAMEDMGIPGHPGSGWGVSEAKMRRIDKILAEPCEPGIMKNRKRRI